MRNVLGATVRIFSACALLSSWSAIADSPPVQMCSESPSAPSCTAVRGDRSEGWVPQTRSEVMAQHGMVSTVQPLAAILFHWVELERQVRESPGGRLQMEAKAAVERLLRFPDRSSAP